VRKLGEQGSVGLLGCLAGEKDLKSEMGRRSPGGIWRRGRQALEGERGKTLSRAPLGVSEVQAGVSRTQAPAPVHTCR